MCYEASSTQSGVAFKHKPKKTNLQFTYPDNLDKNEHPKRNIHGLLVDKKIFQTE